MDMDVSRIAAIAFQAQRTNEESKSRTVFRYYELSVEHARLQPPCFLLLRFSRSSQDITTLTTVIKVRFYVDRD